MPICTRCQNNVSWCGPPVGRCQPCEFSVQQILVQFRGAFLAACSDGVLTPQEWAQLVGGLYQYRIAVPEAMAYVRPDAMSFVERVLAFATLDGEIAPDREIYLQQLCTTLMVPAEFFASIGQRVAANNKVWRVRRTGQLPTVTPTVRLDSDEICHLEVEAIYRRTTSTRVVDAHGRLIATSKSLIFLSPEGGTSAPWKSVMSVECESEYVYLELTKKAGNGLYRVREPAYVEAVIDTILRISRREIVSPGSASTRHIPQDVKTAVWQRDQGRCAQCSATPEFVSHLCDMNRVTGRRAVRRRHDASAAGLRRRSGGVRGARRAWWAAG